ncbi:SDR family NAD(P)-dependent oxidoreductase [Salicibibacter halophilus]|uniref:SDR family NAD(P)-dependent oxidoreductase n=1 Tax=Salicibibacter halophilus TaxID=2502791 RepID=A0A514LIC6_9BACI|nr:SDR family NAD(P)-dependent oxidoreductase [Salicibibacter halophilus]QDI91600.1 SDR family NAD(P)-dependent oxidoreductase [Salicibibacter halophilus]
MKKILVTGGAGFIGSHVVDALVEQEKTVLIADNLSTGRSAHVNPGENTHFFDVDITDRDGLEQIFRQHHDIDGVIHLAAQSKASPSLEAPGHDANINIHGTVNVLELMKTYEVGRFIYASSAAVYGDQETLPITEDAAVGPLSPYGVSKYAGEEYVKAYQRLYDIDARILRFANVYGPRQSVDTEAGVITIFVEQLLNGDQPGIYGDGKQTRDFIYVKDVASAILCCLFEAPSESGGDPVYNVSTGQETSIETLLRELSAIMDQSYHPLYMGERAGDIEKSYLDNRKLRTNFTWKPETSLEDGLAATIAHAQRSGDLYEKID